MKKNRVNRKQQISLLSRKSGFPTLILVQAICKGSSSAQTSTADYQIIRKKWRPKHCGPYLVSLRHTEFYGHDILHRPASIVVSFSPFVPSLPLSLSDSFWGLFRQGITTHFRAVLLEKIASPSQATATWRKEYQFTDSPLFWSI